MVLAHGPETTGMVGCTTKTLIMLQKYEFVWKKWTAAVEAGHLHLFEPGLCKHDFLFLRGPF